MKKNPLNDIEETELTDDLKVIADVIGMDMVRIMLENFQGLSFYIPRLTRLDKFVERYILQNSERPLKMIAKELNVSEQFLRDLEKRKRAEKTARLKKSNQVPKKIS